MRADAVFHGERARAWSLMDSGVTVGDWIERCRSGGWDSSGARYFLRMFTASGAIGVA